MNEFHFLRPWWLAALAALAAVLWRRWQRRGHSQVWENYCDPALLPYLLDRGTGQGGRVTAALLTLAAILTIVALAGPTYERVPTPVFRDTSALVVMLKLDRSMTAEDIRPSRLERARFMIADLLRERTSGQSALVVYSDDAFVVTPLTDDVATIESQLPILRPDLLPAGGSNAAAAIALGLELLSQAGIPAGDLLLVTDTLGPVEGTTAREAIAGSPARLSVLALATAAGAPLPDPRGDFIRDAGGNVILSKLDPDRLRELASAGRGEYQPYVDGRSEVARLAAVFSGDIGAGETSVEATALTSARWRELGPYLLLGVLPLAAIAFRRGVVAAAALALGLGAAPGPASAGWWLTPDQAGQQAFEAEDYAAASERFADPRWRAAAQYQAGEFSAAAETLADLDDPDSVYNRGNALAREGQLMDAIAAYEDALKMAPDHVDAKHNKELLEELLARQTPPPDGQQQGEDGEEESDDPAGAGSDGLPQGESSEQQNSGQSGQQQADSDAQEPGEDQSQGGQSDSNDSTTDSQSAQAEPGAEPEADQDNDALQAAEATAQDAVDEEARELEMATQQWLQQIPDDPGGLLRRKFEYEARKRQRDALGGYPRW